MKLRLVATPSLLVIMLTLAGCAASYDERMKYLDQASQKGVEYRGKLQEQHTEPSRDACLIGFDLLKADPPADTDGGEVSKTWRDQVQESYVKSCMTGELRPKPDPSGIGAVTPVPISSKSPSLSTQSGTPKG
jgi:hypothetical protein